MQWKLQIRRLILPILAAYFLHWGIWALVAEAEQILMSLLTRMVNFLADMFGAAHIEVAVWSARINGANAATYCLPPLAIGLLLGFWILRKKGKALETTL